MAMTKSEAKNLLARAKLAVTGTTTDPGFADAAMQELALYYAPGPFGQQLTDAERDERAAQREVDLLEATVNGD